MLEKIERSKSIMAYILTFAGLGLLFASLYIHTAGEIHYSVLVAVGEVFTFAGTIVGIENSFENRLRNILKEMKLDGKIKGKDEH